jgi:hypothetical protein
MNHSETHILIDCCIAASPQYSIVYGMVQKLEVILFLCEIVKVQHIVSVDCINFFPFVSFRALID